MYISLIYFILTFVVFGSILVIANYAEKQNYKNVNSLYNTSAITLVCGFIFSFIKFQEELRKKYPPQKRIKK